MKEPMLTLIENAIRASLGPAADAIPRKDFKVAALSVLAALRAPADSAPGAWGYPEELAVAQYQAMIDAAMQGA